MISQELGTILRPHVGAIGDDAAFLTQVAALVGGALCPVCASLQGAIGLAGRTRVWVYAIKHCHETKGNAMRCWSGVMATTT
jgi:hypothetical protein